MPEELVPVEPVGLMTLQEPLQLFAQTEQVVFNPEQPGPGIEGIDVTNNPAAGSALSYLDTQITAWAGRTGTSCPSTARTPRSTTCCGHSPAPCARGCSASGQLAGRRQPVRNTRERARLHRLPRPCGGVRQGTRPAAVVRGPLLPRRRCLAQPERGGAGAHRAGLRVELGKCWTRPFRVRQLRHLLFAIDPSSGDTPWRAGLACRTRSPRSPGPDVQPSPSLSQWAARGHRRGRVAGILVADTDVEQLTTLVSRIDAAGMVPLVITPQGGEVAGRRRPPHAAHGTLHRVRRRGGHHRGGAPPTRWPREST
ncbi:catalase [Kocuria rhizophila]|nr:catalase [Kocuria rhizophila]